MNDLQSKYIDQYGIQFLVRFDVKQDDYIIAMPTTSIDFVFSDTSQDQVIIGPCSKVSYIHLKKGKYFVVHFYPGNLPLTIPNVNLPIQIYDKVVHITPMQEWEKRILNIASFDKQCQTFIQLLQSELKLYIARNAVITSTTKTIRKSKGRLKLSEFYEHSNYSKQYINRVFKTHYGKSPKYFCKIMRFQILMNNLLENYPNHSKLTEIAKKSAYYDQSHMNKDFKVFSGTTPEQFIKITNHQLPITLLQSIQEVYI